MWIGNLTWAIIPFHTPFWMSGSERVRWGVKILRMDMVGYELVIYGFNKQRIKEDLQHDIYSSNKFILAKASSEYESSLKWRRASNLDWTKSKFASIDHNEFRISGLALSYWKRLPCASLFPCFAICLVAAFMASLLFPNDTHSKFHKKVSNDPRGCWCKTIIFIIILV